ncbi:MAG: Txe/YoeB family addiction module toxin [Chamaesiphon sp.]|nr:Txe/YoeB family addiction module toxin [Chamaesiphon sp.]
MSAKKKDKKPSDDSKPEIVIIQRRIIFDEAFREDLHWWYRQDIQKANKILDLIESVCIDPFSGIGKPEPLKFMEANTWSRRIDLEHRLIYRVQNESIQFLQARYHYD